MFKLKEINYFKLSAHFYKITIAIIVIISVWFVFFLHNDVYLVLIKIEEIMELKTKAISSEVVQKDKLDQIIIDMEQKENINSTLEDINNPFSDKKPEQIKNSDSLLEESPTGTATSVPQSTF